MNLIIHNSQKIGAELIRSSDKKQKDKGIKTIKNFHKFSQECPQSQNCSEG